MSKMTLRIVEVDHEANAFWGLGEVRHEVPIEALFDSLPAMDCGAPATHEAACYMADLFDEHGDIVRDREISRDVAQALLDEPIDVLRERFRRWLWETHGATG